MKSITEVDGRAPAPSREAAPLDERALFEAWLEKAWPMLTVDFAPLNGFYKGDDGACIQDKWEGWQARAALAQPEAPVVDGELTPLPVQHEELLAQGKCESCDGRGHDGEMHYQGEFQPPEPCRCPDCDGTGQVAIDARAALKNELHELGELQQAVKRRSMIYQVSDKEWVAKLNGVAPDTYYNLPYVEWKHIRDAAIDAATAAPPHPEPVGGKEQA